MKHPYPPLFILLLLFTTLVINAQDLDPRAYVRIPVNVSFLFTGFAYSSGGVITDATAPIQDLKAKIESPLIGAGRSFSLFGQTAQVTAVLPYAWAQANALVGGEYLSTTRSGFSDMRFRISMLFHGAKAATPAEIVSAPRQTILGGSLMIISPTGQYFPEKLINLGTNRWSFKPEVAISQPFGKQWLIDFYSGIWFFTTNDSFYPGASLRKQKPMGSFQAHLSYNIKPRMWAAFDATFYTGGMTTVSGSEMEDRQSNSRVGATMVMPVGKLHSIKLAFSTGAIIRYGANFSSVSIAWQTFFYSLTKKK